MLFWKRKKEEKIKNEEKKNIPVQEIPLVSQPCKKYKTNYYSSRSSQRRDSLRNKKERKSEIGKYKLEVELTHLPHCFQRMSDLLLKTESGFIQIDHLLISPYGLFLLEVNNSAGLIVGEEADSKWYQVITWRVKTFPNPLHENEVRIQELRQQIQLEESIPIFSYVTFNRRCNLKVFLGSVFYDIDLLASILKLIQTQPVILTEEDILQIVERIKDVNISDLGVRNEYAARQRRARMQQRPKYGDLRCSICQKAVTERIARYCLNRPETFSWKIYCEKHQKEMNKALRQRSIELREKDEERGSTH